ncbi:uncharacterized protein MYCFIDRAFT_209611 [Pseudocercospora fijiensis CIRAD86]|uniref:Gag1-like clamp domain-containing protein n=1 Tax=Pseudocercospora fijiensis (strain CIRAD86) TaxID=383855 RepID=N1Q7W3_PSEFD|nr:uncharacterized protein MYCFIDRAFT_209611 [Pseudocercospora fijiensis CIRAD86]EME87791.1 hypothetical protein MYCFIDRAFT_209611 [Pseudocercospora fijiensis CIRAD86]
MHLPGSHHRSSEQQQELRDARRLLRERIKDDWEYPTLPAWRSSGKKEPATEEDIEDGIAGFRFHTPSNHDREGPNASNGALGLSFNPTEWRERECSDLDASDAEGEASLVKGSSVSAKSKQSEYKFEGPDSVGSQLRERRHARKRRRQVRLQEEMEWNDGLAHWMRRRDIWCSARTVAEVQSHENPVEEDAQEGEEDADSDSASTSSPRASTSSSVEEDGNPADPENDETPDTPESTPSTTPDMTASTPPVPPPITSPPMIEVLVPIAPPLLPNHPIRRRINHNMYPEIYTKIILQSRTPSIPINLLTLIKALVQGWKDDGEWPPKNGPVEKSIGRKKGSARDGLKEKVGRVLRLTGTGTGGHE